MTPAALHRSFSSLLTARVSVDGSEIFVLGRSKEIVRLDRVSGELRPPGEILARHVATGRGTFSADGRFFAYESRTNTVVWKLATDEALFLPAPAVAFGYPWRITSLLFSPDDEQLFVAGADQTVRAWALDWKARQPSYREFTGHHGMITGLALPNGTSLLAGACSDQMIHLWQTDTGREAGLLQGNETQVCVIAASPDGTLLATGAADGAVKLWASKAVERSPAALALPSYVGAGDELSLSPDGAYLLAHDVKSGLLELWNTKGLSSLGRIDPQLTSLRFAAVGPEARVLVAAGDEGVKIFRREGTNYTAHRVSMDGIDLPSFSPDGTQIAISQGWNGTGLWQTESGRQVAMIPNPGTSSARSCAISPDNQFVAMGYYDGTIVLWSKKLQRVQSLAEAINVPVSALHFSSDSRYLAAAAYDGFARVYETKTGREHLKFRASQFNLGAICFSPDGTRLVTGDDEGAVRIWALWPGGPQEVADLSHGPGFVSAVAFADGHDLISVSAHVLHIWPAK